MHLWLVAATTFLVDFPVEADGVPAPLACLERHYPARAAVRDGAWWLVVDGGASIPYDGDPATTPEQRWRDPPVRDLFADRYPPGPIVPVTRPDFDPGRARSEALLRAAYPASRLTGVTFIGQRIRVNQAIVPALGRVEQRLRAEIARDRRLAPFLHQLGGGYAPRNIAGTDRASAHAFGIAVDINVARADYWRWQRPPAPLRWRNRIPQAIVDAFEAEGFIWGGRWYHYDTMHFEYRPELLDQSCYP